MPLSLDLQELESPLLEFGGPGEFSDPRVGLLEAGPFDLRFGAARSHRVCVGLIGPAAMVAKVAEWLKRTEGELVTQKNVANYPTFPGFEEVFRAKLITDTRWMIALDEGDGQMYAALAEPNVGIRFELVLNAFQSGIRKLANLESTKPDVVLCCLSDEILAKCRTVTKTVSDEEKKAATALKKRQASRQMDLFDVMLPDEETADDLLFRDFRRALKARAMKERIPIQIATNNLVEDGRSGQGPAERAWNSSVGLYYKSGGIPWRLKSDGPETCFVGISFHHLKTRNRHLVQSSIAQAFSSYGEGFALRGGDVEWTEGQGRNVHLTKEQAGQLGRDILDEYRDRTGSVPLRVILHKTSSYSDDERSGFREALAEVPIVELINLMRTSFRLVRFGAYPPNRGTLCTVNGATAFLFTTGYMPELQTYPGPHIPAPCEIRSDRPIDVEQAARDILGLTRMNWNTASITGGHPVTLSFARQVGGIMAEYGSQSDERPLASFRYYM